MAVAAGTPAEAGAPARRQSVPAGPGVPFVAAAHEHVEPAFTFTVTPGASGTEFGPFDVPAYGYLRHVMLEISLAGGTLGAGVLAADYPFNIFERISLADVNGSPIYELDGYAALWSNIVGGYAFEQDQRGMADYDGTINAKFYIRIPVEINHFDGLGAIANQNAAASYKVSLRTRPSAQLYSTAPTTIPTATVRGFLEAWSLPNEVDLAGNAQEQMPPLHGTSQYWSAATKATVAGANTIGLTRVGNMLRNVIVIARTAAGVRQDDVFPDPAQLQWDANTILQESQRGHLIRFRERLVDVTRDTGVFAYLFSHTELGRAGDGPPSLWLATVQSSRIEIQGTTVTAGSLQIVTNDVAPVEVVPSERFEQPSRTGFNPAVAGAPTRRSEV